MESPSNTTLGLLAPGLPPVKKMIAEREQPSHKVGSVIPE